MENKKSNTLNSFKKERGNKNTILNDWDKKILLEGVKSIIEKILKVFRGKLPDGLIYPDTSARPLFYLFDPIFTKIAEEKGIKKPISFFMKIGHPDIFTTVFEDNEERELFYDEVEKILIEKIENGDEALESNKDYFFKKAEDTAVKREFEAERAREIERHNENLSGRGVIANLAVIDDFSNQGQTRKEIDYAFGYELPYFSIFANQTLSKVDQEKAGVLIDPDNYPKNPVNGESTKLSYTMGDSKSFIGVTKKSNIEDKYSLPIKKDEKEEQIIFAKQKKQLRDEMKQLGEQIAHKMNFK